MTAILNLKLIGYWKSESYPDFPEPTHFVDPGWGIHERNQVIQHLKNGQAMPYASGGTSWCRFNCGYKRMGSHEFTDGVYVWPEGLLHYIEMHSVRLPEKIVRSMLENDIPVNEIDLTQLSIDYEWWATIKAY